MIEVEAKASCRTIPVFGNDTSCRLIDKFDPPVQSAGLTYYNLLPAAARLASPPGPGGDNSSSNERLNASGAQRRQGATSVAGQGPFRIDHLRPKAYLRYDADAWPSFCGTSASFSLWLHTETLHGAALLSRYEAPDPHGHSRLRYALYAEGHALAVKSETAGIRSVHALPGSYGRPLAGMQAMTRRHVAFVFNASDDTTRTFLDGRPLGLTQHAPGTIGALDCNLSGALSYTGLGHLAPGAWGLRGVIQDWRYYHKQALTDQQVLELAEGGGSDGGVGPQRTCRHANEGGDSPDWTDAYGHDCAWYYDNRRSFAGICGPRLVRQFCPEACGVSKPCFEVRSV